RIHVGIDETCLNLLDRVTPFEHSALKLRQRVIPVLIANQHEADTVNQRVQEFVTLWRVIAQRVHRVRNIGLCRLRDTRVIVSTRVIADRVKNIRVMHRLETVSHDGYSPPFIWLMTSSIVGSSGSLLSSSCEASPSFGTALKRS